MNSNYSSLPGIVINNGSDNFNMPGVAMDNISDLVK